jgi:hypothetical protein
MMIGPQSAKSLVSAHLKAAEERLSAVREDLHYIDDIETRLTRVEQSYDKAISDCNHWKTRYEALELRVKDLFSFIDTKDSDVLPPPSPASTIASGPSTPSIFVTPPPKKRFKCPDAPERQPTKLKLPRQCNQCSMFFAAGTLCAVVALHMRMNHPK